MLHAISKLPKHNIGDIEWILANQINADAFGANQSYHLLDLLLDWRRDVSEKQMRFVEEEDQFPFLRFANYWEILEQFREHPKQECGVNLRRLLHQFIGSKDVNHSFAALCLDQVIEIECGFAEKFVRALRFEREQIALDRSGAGGRNVPVLRFELVGAVPDVLQHRTQVLEVQQKPSIFVGDFENDVEHAFLCVVQLEQAPKQQRPHFRNSRAHRVTLLAEYVPKHHRRGFASEIVDLKLLRALEDFGIISARLTETREVAFHVCHEDRHAAGAEILRERLKRNRFARTGGAGDQSVAA